MKTKTREGEEKVFGRRTVSSEKENKVDLVQKES